jgi:adenosylhomocysteine nucleosidase
MDVGKIGFVVGLTAEAALLRGTAFAVGVGGGTPAGAEAAALRLAAQGAVALISFGLAGGLNFSLAPGAVLVPRAVVEGPARFSCDPAFTAWLSGANCDAVLAAQDIAVTVAQKAALFAQTGAAAVDLESGAVARVAAQAGLPFAVLRAVADPASKNLPPAALVALNHAGRIGFFRVLASVLRHPRQIPALLALARDASAARKALLDRVIALDVERRFPLSRE